VRLALESDAATAPPPWDSRCGAPAASRRS